MPPPSPALLSDVEEQAIAASLGDQDAFGDLYERYADSLLRFLLLRTHNNLTVAEDLAATVWERVARSIRNYETRGNGFPAWLFTIGRRCVQEHYRTMVRRPERLDGEMLTWDRADSAESPEALYEQKVKGQQVAAAVQTLPHAQRRCVTLRFFVGLSLQETASVMGKNPNAIKQLQRRALGALHKRLGGTSAAPLRTETTYLVLDTFETASRSEDML